MIIGLVGLGAVGAVIAATLSPRADVRVLVRDPAAAREITNRGGIVVDDDPPAPVTIAADATVLDGCDIVLVSVKTYSTVAALAPFRGTPLANVPWVAFQNGIDSASQIEDTLGGRGGIALAPTTMAAMRDGNGASRLMGPGITNVGWVRDRAGDDALLAAFVRILAVGLAAEYVAPVEPYVWAKLVANAAINPLTALAGVSNGEIVARADLRARAGAIAREVAIVAVRSDIALPFDDPIAYVEDVVRNTASNRSSMLEDLEAGRPLELESITGAVVRRGEALGVPVPENARVLDEVRARLKA